MLQHWRKLYTPHIVACLKTSFDIGLKSIRVDFEIISAPEGRLSNQHTLCPILRSAFQIDLSTTQKKPKQNINPIPENATGSPFSRIGENLPDLLFLTSDGLSFQLLNSCHRTRGLHWLQGKFR